MTTDVDLIAAVTALSEYHALEERLEQQGLSRDLSPDAPICRWRAGAVAVDLMPTDEAVLGFSNAWYAEAAPTATTEALPSGRMVRLISAPAFLGTKFEAFRTRGRGDFAASHDFEDIINIVEGRVRVVQEVRAAAPALASYLAAAFSQLMRAPAFMDILPGLVAYDELHAQRVSAVRKRIGELASIKQPTGRRKPAAGASRRRRRTQPGHTAPGGEHRDGDLNSCVITLQVRCLPRRAHGFRVLTVRLYCFNVESQFSDVVAL